ncbi:hypothetical protein E2C01_058002 [Portunus trituberculatus]|uniref:Uncharacterized protein n=1 Tax=Portunus trituberculatus TaxID=210409 RepID=A0A5B7H4W3_PORTR|nr:hypothetical protein [Portunus trituberculatus]
MRRGSRGTKTAGRFAILDMIRMPECYYKISTTFLSSLPVSCISEQYRWASLTLHSLTID